MRKSNLQKRTSSLPWDDLRCVLAVARTGSLSGAARSLGIEHSTIFRRLNAIEKQLGVKLFQRARSGYIPTANGEFAASAASSMETEVLSIERRMLGADERLTGVVRLATSELFAGFLLPLVLNGFLLEYPGVEVEIDVSSRMLRRIRRRSTCSEGRSARFAMLYGSHAIAREMATAALEELPWLGFDESVAYLAIARWQRAQSPDKRARVRFSSLPPMLQATAEGLGVAVLPLFAAGQHNALARMGPVLDQPRMALWVLSHKETRENARVRALSRHLTKHIPMVLEARQKIE
jgi:DNA-binding transcriptional LysR family regulator